MTFLIKNIKRYVQTDYLIYVLIGVFSLVLILLSSLYVEEYVSIGFPGNSSSNNQVLGEADNTYDEIDYWQKILSKNPNYLPAYIRLSEIQNALGNYSASYELQMRIKSVDPNRN